VVVPPRTGQPLPLRLERTHDELRIQAQATLRVLSQKLGVDATPTVPSFGQAIDDAARRLGRTRSLDSTSQPAVDRGWEAFASVIWQFDAHTQDHLTAVSDTQACGYQLGRGLAECYWALDPGSTQGWTAWTFLFDHVRCTELTRQASRLGDYMDSFSAAAVTGSLEVWKLLAADEEWRREPTVHDDLYQQNRNWYELLVLAQDPTRAVRPYQLMRSWRVTLTVARAFWSQLLLATLGLAALGALIWAVSEKNAAHWIAVVTTVVSALGLSSAGLSAKVKNQAQALSSRFRQDAYTDLLAASITTVPAPPHRRHGPSRQSVVDRAVRRRHVTPSTLLT
jgi:hypothetical protein